MMYVPDTSPDHVPAELAGRTALFYRDFRRALGRRIPIDPLARILRCKHQWLTIVDIKHALVACSGGNETVLIV